MRKAISLISITLLTLLNSYGQKLNLNDLTNLCSKKNWENINQTLLVKGWEYYDSEKGNTNKYNIITWSFKKDYDDDKALGWFYLYTYEGFPNKISYTVHNNESYSLIQKSISSAGFKLINSEIENNQLISTFKNTSYTLKISTEKRNDNDWSSRSWTTYNITLIKNSGIYDPNNGKKISYHYDNVVQTEYTLLNGKINGQIKAYHYNGKLKKIGNYTNGVENGLFKVYDDTGNIELEYFMSNGELNGVFKAFHSNGKLKKLVNYQNGVEHGLYIDYDGKGNKEAECIMANGKKNGELKTYSMGKIDVSTTYKDNIKNGKHTEYYYLYSLPVKERVILKRVGEYLNDEKNGTWQLFSINENGYESPLTVENYKNDKQNGLFKKINGDSLIIGNYKNDELHGEYKVYLDLSNILNRGINNIDIKNLALISDGNYNMGLKSGYWKNFESTGALLSEGLLSNGLETGEWKFYYPNSFDDENFQYSKQLYLIQNYYNGVLEGKSTRYSYLQEKEYPCSESDEHKNSLGSCIHLVYEKVLETSYYKYGQLNGPFELRDSVNEIISKGFFKDDLKEGEWLNRYNGVDLNEESYYIYQKGHYNLDKREGKWIQFSKEDKITKSFTFDNDLLHGEYILWNQFNKPIEKKQFYLGNLTELTVFDSLGISPIKKYEIFDENNNSYKCKKTDFLENGIMSQEYWVKKDEEINNNLFELNFLIAISSENENTIKAFKDGEFKYLNLENQPIIIGKYYKKEKIGKWSFYYYDQYIKIEYLFIDNKQTDEKYLNLKGELFSGEFIYYDDFNGTKEIRKIKDGIRNGKTIYIDTKTKKTIKKEIYKNGEKR